MKPPTGCQRSLWMSLSEFKDVGQMTMKMRMVKSQEELELYRKMAKIADHGGFAAREGTIHILRHNFLRILTSSHIPFTK